MKLHGKNLEEPPVTTVVIPRPNGDLVFQAKPVLNSDEFNEIMPRPEPPERLHKGGQKQKLVDDPRYKEDLSEWIKAKTDWTIIQSLSATEGLEWETVDMNDPKTWGNYNQELIDAKLLPTEIAKITDAVFEAIGLDQAKIEEATKRFLAGQREAQNEQSSRSTEPNPTESGEPAKDSE